MRKKSLLIPRRRLTILIRKHKDTLNSFSLLRKNGESKDYIQQPCYAYLSSWQGKEDFLDAEWFVDWRGDGSTRVNNKEPSEYTEKYIKWVVEESNWSNCILNSAKEVYKKGVIIDAKSFTASWCVATAILIRYTREMPHIINWWGKIEKYIEPHIALFLAHIVANRQQYVKEGATFYLSKDWGGGHSMFDCKSSISNKKSLANLINNKPSRDITTPAMSESTNYHHKGGICNLFWDGVDKNDFEFVKGKEVYKDDGWGGKVHVTGIHPIDSLKKIVTKFVENNT